MAHFRATIKGNRGEASRLGTKNSGIQASINGWDVGVDVNIVHCSDGKDRVYIYSNGGSNGFLGKLIATIIEGENE